mmetsp:Transcript_37450/g.121804  ORF Transcript_37450/g.121804 Transcript_37450/m.121804 type:complete len:117 (-) Transcript_37450:31-381(-)
MRPKQDLPFSTPTAAQQPELAEADVADVQPMQIDPPGSGRNLAVAPCSTAAPAHHAAVAFVQPVQLGISVFYYVMEFAEGRGQIHFHLLGWLESGEPHHIISVGNSRDSVVVTPLE